MCMHVCIGQGARVPAVYRHPFAAAKGRACPVLLCTAGRQRVEVQLEAVVEGSLSLSSVPVRWAGGGRLGTPCSEARRPATWLPEMQHWVC